MKRALIVTASMIALALAVPARADDVEQAKSLFAAGASAYEKGDFIGAIQAFEGAQKLAPRPAIMFSLAQAHRRQYYVDGKAEHLRAAVELYRKYIADAPQGNRRADASQALAELAPLAERLGGGSSEGPKAKEPARLSINSSGTPNAKVSLDGAAPVDAPLIGPVAPGAHKVRIFAEGFIDELRDVTAVDGTMIAQDVPLREQPAEITLKTDAGAKVDVDGRTEGTTPLARPLSLTAGAHWITVTKNGREAFAQEVTVARGEKKTLDATLPGSRQRTTATVVLLSGVAAVVAGGAFMTVALVQEAKATNILEQQGVNALTPNDLDRYDSARKARASWTTASIVGFGAGAALLAAGLVLWVFDAPHVGTAPRRDDGPKTGPSRKVEPVEVGFAPAFGPGYVGGAASLTF